MTADARYAELPPPIPLIGYADKLSVKAGDIVNFKVSSLLDQPFTAQLVRIVSADPNPDGPGIIEHPVSSSFAATYPGREQRFYPGSWARTNRNLDSGELGAISLTANIFPTLIDDQLRTIIACDHASLSIKSGVLTGSIHGITITAPAPLAMRNWYCVTIEWNSNEQQLTLRYRSISRAGHEGKEQLCTEKVNAQKLTAENRSLHAISINAPVSIAARIVDDQAVQFFNGKIESPAIYGTTATDTQKNHGANNLSLLAHWDFSIGIDTLKITDNGPSQLNGEIYNLPARAMTGSNWDGTEMCWRHAPDQYGAIHFHDDDIVDFDWDTDFSYVIPDNLPSGIYAAKIDCNGYSDAMPFFVCPAPGKRSADLAVLISTFTYSVYGNHARPDFNAEWKERFKQWDAYPWNPAEYPEYGLSTYNFHRDGSGICHASHRRPLFNMKPGYVTFGYGPGSGLRHLQADTHLISWLHNQNIAYDIITDDELHTHGVKCLQGYKALTTGSHPEYHTPETLDALHHYCHGPAADCSGMKKGTSDERNESANDTHATGNLIYLGGNGFYWKVALHTQQEGAIEIRRAEGGIRAWAAEPGEYYQAFDGQYGGLWRRNGRPPQELVGIGFSAQGQFEGSAYRRHKASYDDRFNWLFDGINDEILGDFGLSGGGAAGFELDRADTRLGTPENAAILASSFDRGETFVLVPEEQLTHITTWSGEPIADLLRADMVYFETEGGGRVFSTGSITFCGSLPHNDFDNNISRLIANVVHEFCKD